MITILTEEQKKISTEVHIVGANELKNIITLINNIYEEICEIKKEVYEIKDLINHKKIDVKCFGNPQNLDIECEIRKALKMED